MILKKPIREKITKDFLQNYIGGEFTSVQKHKIGRPTVFTGIIKRISLDNGVIAFTRFVDNQEIKVIQPFYRIYRYYKDNRIIFESKDLFHTVILYHPRLKE